jgi:branched-chain amino acid transport system ATP-binding protein
MAATLKWDARNLVMGSLRVQRSNLMGSEPSRRGIALSSSASRNDNLTQVITTTPALETRGLTKSFGALTVASAIDFRLERGARHALIGPNGAGKTSFVNLVTGALPPNAGSIVLGEEEITGLPQAARVKRGLVRTFQVTQLFRGLSVLENVTLTVCERHGIGGDLWRAVGDHRAAIDEAYGLLDQMGLAEEALRPVATLPYGRQRLTEIAIALGLSPKVLLLDEPAAGVPSSESGLIIEVIEQLSPDMAVLIIEPDMDLVFRLARRITVLVQGRVLVEGVSAEIAADPRVRQVYLGERVAR